MGYTHYWGSNSNKPILAVTNSSAASEDQWDKLVKAKDFIIKHCQEAGIEIEDLSDAEAIDINGVRGDSHENLVLYRNDLSSFGFCKTARKPYDLAVVAVLTACQRLVPGFSWRSDGDEDEVKEGVVLSLFAVNEILKTEEI